jgi:hypothetical protein
MMQAQAERLQMCITAQTWITKAATIVERHGCTRGREHMLLIFGVLVILVAAALIFRARVPGGVNGAQLGWMSQRWLAEHRASNAP